jgi:hypothetical protein
LGAASAAKVEIIVKQTKVKPIAIGLILENLSFFIFSLSPEYNRNNYNLTQQVRQSSISENNSLISG